MTVNTGDTVRVTAIMNHSLEGDVQNVWWMNQVTGSATDAQFMQKAAEKLDIAYNYIDQYMPDTLDFVEIAGQNITTGNPLPTVGWPTLTSGGVDVADPLPAALSGLGLGRTGVHRVVFRKFFGPFTEANQIDASWDTVIPAAILTLLQYMDDAYASGTGTAQAGVWSTVFLQWYPLIEVVTRSVAAYQRRRRKGRGI